MIAEYEDFFSISANQFTIENDDAKNKKNKYYYYMLRVNSNYLTTQIGEQLRFF